MTTLQSRIDKLTKSTRNVVNAKNPSQREAAEQFLVQRARELDAERTEIAAWLEEADRYVNENMPEINSDAGHQHNQEWRERLAEYQDVSNALDAAWNALMGTQEAA